MPKSVATLEREASVAHTLQSLKHNMEAKQQASNVVQRDGRRWTEYFESTGMGYRPGPEEGRKLKEDTFVNSSV